MDIEGLKKLLREKKVFQPTGEEAADALEELEAKCNHIMSEHGKRLEEVARLQQELEEARKDATNARFESRVKQIQSLILAGHKFDWPYTSMFDDGGLAYREAQSRIDAAREKQG